MALREPARLQRVLGACEARTPFRSIAIAAVCLGTVWLVACGGGDRAEKPPPRGSSGSTVNAGSAVVAQANAIGRRYRNDGDRDIGEAGARALYLDNDDNDAVREAVPASPAETHMVVKTMERYFRFARAADGRGVCSMLDPGLATAIPLDYGRPGPAYLRYAKSCEAVVALIFKHLRRELSAPVAVTGVLTSEGHDYALLGSTTMPARYASLRREGGAWKIQTLVGFMFL